MNGLLLHCGANLATKDEVYDTPTPEATETHVPVPHGLLLDTIHKHVTQQGFAVEQEEYGLWSKGNRMFGVLGLSDGSLVEDSQLTVGIRNSHDKTFPAGMAVGNRVFVCDNLSFSAEIVVLRRHTKYVLRDLDKMVAEASGRIGQARITQERRITAYKETDMDDAMVHDLLIRSVDARVIANTYVPKVLSEWREPSHEEFAPRTAWSLFNGYTEVLKAVSPLDLSRRTIRLHGLMDGLTGAFGLEEATPDFDGQAMAVEVGNRLAAVAGGVQ